MCCIDTTYQTEVSDKITGLASLAYTGTVFKIHGILCCSYNLSKINAGTGEVSDKITGLAYTRTEFEIHGIMGVSHDNDFLGRMRND